MLDSLKALKTGNLDAVNDNMLFPLLRWCSGSITDLAWCAEVNKYFFFLPKNIQKSYLSVGLKDRATYIKYPKATKEQTDKVTALKRELAKQFYRWSEQEMERNITNLEFIDWPIVLNALGCDSKEYKILGIKENKIQVKKMPAKQSKKPVKSLLDF